MIGNKFYLILSFSVSDAPCVIQRMPGVHGLNHHYDNSMVSSEQDCELSCLFKPECGQASLINSHGALSCRKYRKEEFSLTIDETSVSFTKICPWGKLK